MDSEAYLTVRDSIKTGYYGLCVGSNLLSKTIQAVTDSEYSHAFTFWRTHGRVMIIEATGAGVVLMPASNLFERGYKRIDVFKAPDPVNGQAVIGRLLKSVGNKYDLLQDWRIAVRKFLPKLGMLSGANDRDICSEVTVYGQWAGGSEMLKDSDGSYVTPADLGKVGIKLFSF